MTGSFLPQSGEMVLPSILEPERIKPLTGRAREELFIAEGTLSGLQFFPFCAPVFHDQ